MASTWFDQAKVAVVVGRLGSILIRQPNGEVTLASVEDLDIGVGILATLFPFSPEVPAEELGHSFVRPF